MKITYGNLSGEKLRIFMSCMLYCGSAYFQPKEYGRLDKDNKLKLETLKRKNISGYE